MVAGGRQYFWATRPEIVGDAVYRGPARYGSRTLVRVDLTATGPRLARRAAGEELMAAGRRWVSRSSAAGLGLYGGGGLRLWYGRGDCGGHRGG